MRIAIHGGAGEIKREKLSTEAEQARREVLSAALEQGYAVLSSGGSAVAAVHSAVEQLENSPLFNAGKGSVLTEHGTVEMDAAIMDGRTRNAGAVASVMRIKNPVRLAREVMEHSTAVMLLGAGAERFAESRGFELVTNEYFITERRRRQWEKVAATGGQALDHTAESTADDKKFGTVGAVALDTHGNIAAATSTGGLTNKRFGRIGDSPIIGSGCYADNDTCAVSATGDGEYFIRSVAAFEIAAHVAYRDMDIVSAADAALAKVQAIGGEGGFIALDRSGNIAMPFNSAGMYRGYTDDAGVPIIHIFRP